MALRVGRSRHQGWLCGDDPRLMTCIGQRTYGRGKSQSPRQSRARLAGKDTIMIRHSAGYAPAPMPDARATADAPLVPDAPQGAAPAQRERSRSLRGLLTLLAPALYLLTKLKFLLLFGKLGLTGLSMLISVWAYAALWGLGWAAAVGFVALLFVHEMGHWLMMRAKGVPATAPVFIPFLGAVIGMRAMPRSVQDEAVIGIAGPIAGTAGAFACLGLAHLYGGRLWPLLAMMGLFLNLFNLLPVSPLDGGRIVAAISRWLWPVGLAGLVGLFLLHPNPFLLLIVLVGGPQTIARFRGRYAPTARPSYGDVSARQRVTLGVLYFGLIALIAVTMLGNPLVRSVG